MEELSNLNWILDLLRSGIRLTTPILLAALGGAISNQAGVLNFALEGKMLLGAFLGITSAFWLHSTELGVCVAALSGIMIGFLFAVLYIKYQVNLIILAIALNLLIAEGTVFILRTTFGNLGTWSDPSIRQLPDIHLGLIEKIPFFGPLISGYNIIVYISWIVVIGLYILLFHTKFGHHVRAVGKNQDAAEALGINVRRVKFFSLMLGGALAALGGAFLSVGHLTLFTRDMSNGRGWIGVSAALFGFNHPIGVFFSSLLFGIANALAVRLQMVTQIPPSLIQFFPNAMAILALVLVALKDKWREALNRKNILKTLRKTSVKARNLSQ